MNYTEVTVICINSEFAQIIEAELSEMPFESFKTDSNTIKGYIPSTDFTQESLKSVLRHYESEVVDVSTKTIEHSNWNAVWEADYEPVKIGNEVFIGAPFHDSPDGFAHYITINPNMSFGTGHHPTTTLMLQALTELNINEKKVLDFGSGSGILAIYCGLKNARGVGIEIDVHAADVARENLILNQTKSFTIKTGGVEAIGEDLYDIVLANINKNVIEECLPILHKALNQGGQLICSGFLESDINPLTLMLTNRSFEITAAKTLDNWALIVAKR